MEEKEIPGFWEPDEIRMRNTESPSIRQMDKKWAEGGFARQIPDLVQHQTILH